MTRTHKSRSKTSRQNHTGQTQLRDTSAEGGLDATKTESVKHEPPQTTISTAQLNGESLDVSTLETWLWNAACSIRGATDAPKFKDFILPLIFYKRLSDVFDDEFAQFSVKFGSEEAAREMIEADHQDALKTSHTPIVRFYVPMDYRRDAIRNHPADESLGEFVTDCMRQVAQLNPDLRGVLDVRDFNERQSGQRMLDDDRLGELIQIVSQHRSVTHNIKIAVLCTLYLLLTSS